MSAPGFTAKITSTPTDTRHGKRYGTHNQVFCVFDAIVISQNAFSREHDAEGVWRAGGVGVQAPQQEGEFSSPIGCK